jgi:glycosyltransferase involved in cell wall biosynthesis
MVDNTEMELVSDAGSQNTPIIGFTGQKSAPDCKLSIIIKALNEQDKIEAAILSALVAIQDINAEIILADSLSIDKTVEIASHYPVKIVQLLNAEDRSCGIGPQLGFQYSRGKYIYLLDGDMELNPEFLHEALIYLEDRPDVAGVGGLVEEKNIANLVFELRKNSTATHMLAGEVDRLNMGGLYRRSALENVGYFSNRNLHSFEELELALRLQTKGWRLMRLPIFAIKHYGHTAPLLNLLMSRFRSKYVQGPGEFLRSAWGKPYFMGVVKEFRVFLGVIFGWVLLALSILAVPYSWAPLVVMACLSVLVAIAMIVRKKSIVLGLYSIIDWNLFAIGTVRGGMRKQIRPDDSIASIIVQDMKCPEASNC